MGELSEEDKRAIEEIEKWKKEHKNRPGHKITNPDKFTMPVTSPLTKNPGYEPELSPEDQEALERLDKLLKERKPIPGHKITNPSKFSGPLTPSGYKGDGPIKK